MPAEQTNYPCHRNTGVAAAVALMAGIAILHSPSRAGEKKEGASPHSGRAALAANPEGGYDFKTKEMTGTIVPTGEYFGVTRLIDPRSGRQLIDPRYAALNLFKLMAANQFMGEPRAMERTIETASNGNGLEITWPPTDRHQAEVTARYEVNEPDSVDLTVTVRAVGVYPAYEIFASSYFDSELKPHVLLQPARGRNREPDLVVPTVNDIFRLMLPVFPRDAHAARLCLDGRWDRSESQAKVVKTVPARRYGRCLVYFSDPGETFAVVLMSRPADCFAISTRYHAEKKEDRMTSYSAADFSLFGENLLPGDTRTARLRIALVALEGDQSQPLDAYRKFLEVRPPPPGENVEPPRKDR